MIDSQRILVEVYHRAKGHWTHSTYTLEDEIPIQSLDLRFAVIDAYEMTSLLRKVRQSS